MAENINIDKKIIDKAKVVAVKIDDKEIRKRAFALNIAALSAAEYLTSKGIEADTKLSLCRNFAFAKNLELADVYIDGLRLDVRVTFDETSFCIPKIHDKYDAKPYAYIVVQLGKDLSKAKILGFVPTENLEDAKSNSEYLCYQASVLKPISELKNFLSTIHPKQKIYSSIEHEKIKELCAAFLDDEISESEKVFFIKHIINCPACREIFSDMGDFDVIVSQVKNYHELLNDSTLSVLSGNKKEVDEAIIAGMAVVENEEDEQTTPYASLETEETPFLQEENDILEETASDDANTLEDESLIPPVLPMGVPPIDTLAEVPEKLNDISAEENIINNETENDDFSVIQETEADVLQNNNNAEETEELIENIQEPDLLLEETEDILSEDLQETEPANIEKLTDGSEDNEESLNDISAETDIEEEKLDDITIVDDTQTSETDLADDASLLETEDIQTLDTLEDVDILQESSEDDLTQLQADETEDTSIQPEITVDENSLNETKEDIENIAQETLPDDEPANLVDNSDDSLELLSSDDDLTLNELEDIQSDENLEPQDNTDEPAQAAIDKLSDDNEINLEQSNLETLDELSENADLPELQEIEDAAVDKLSDGAAPLQNIEESETLTDDLKGEELEMLEPDMLEDFSENENNSQETASVTETTASEERTPFKLTLEGEENEESSTDSLASEQENTIEEQTPQELVYDDEMSNTDSIDNLAEINSQTVQSETSAGQDTDSEIQGLLDDDLLALLSDDNDGSENEPVNEQPLKEPVKEEPTPLQQQVQPPFSQYQNVEEKDDIEEDMIELDDEEENPSQQQPDMSENAAEEISQEDETIESLYSETSVPQQEGDEPAQFELAQEPVSAKTVNTTKKIIVGAAVLLLLAAGGVGSWLYNNAKNAQDANLDASADGEFFNMQNQGQGEDDQTPAVSQDINKSMTNSFSDKPAAITITKLSWQVSEKLAADASVKEYLQTAGKNIQMNLQNDLANSADINFNNVIKVSFEIAPDNTMKGMQVLESSGSDQIDDIVLRSIKNTLKYISVPKLKDFKSDYFLTLIINF